MHPLLPPVRDVGSLPPRDMSCGTAPGGSCMGNRCRTGGRPDRIPTTRRVLPKPLRRPTPQGEPAMTLGPHPVHLA